MASEKEKKNTDQVIEGMELSIDELAAVAGGVTTRDWQSVPPPLKRAVTAGAQTAGARYVISVISGSAKVIGVVYAQPVPVCLSRSDMRKTPHICRRICRIWDIVRE